MITLCLFTHCKTLPDSQARQIAYNGGMKKLTAYTQLLLALSCAVIGLVTLINLVLISQRPETISVVNAIIGQGVLIIAFFALARVLFGKAMAKIKEAPTPSQGSNSSDQAS